MKWKSKRFAATAALALTASLALAGCGSDSSSSPTASDGSSGGGSDLTVTLIPKNLGNPYFDTSEAGVKKAMSAIGGSFTQVGPQEATPDGQVPFINTATQQGTKAIVISSDDPSAPCDALKQAMSAGIKVVTFDSDTNADCRDLFVNQATADGIAKVQVDMIAKQIGDSGEIAILSAAANATNQNAWIATMKKELAANHPNIKLDAVVYGNDDDQTSFDKTSALLQQYPNLKGIISPTTVGIAAAARYLSTSDAKGKVALTGLGTPNQMRPTSRTAPSRSSRCGTRRTSATSRRTPRARWSTAPSPVRRVTRSRPATLGTFTVDSDGSRAAGRAVRLRQVATSTSSTSDPTLGCRPTVILRPSAGHRATRCSTRPDTSEVTRAASASSSRSKPDRLEEYRARHAAVWPEMLHALPDTGWHNYSLFLREDGLLIGYLETDDLGRGAGGHGRHRGQRPLAGRDGRVLRRTSTDAPRTRASWSSTRSSTWRTSSLRSRTLWTCRRVEEDERR